MELQKVTVNLIRMDNCSLVSVSYPPFFNVIIFDENLCSAYDYLDLNLNYGKSKTKFLFQNQRAAVWVLNINYDRLSCNAITYKWKLQLISTQEASVHVEFVVKEQLVLKVRLVS